MPLPPHRWSESDRERWCWQSTQRHDSVDYRHHDSVSASVVLDARSADVAAGHHPGV